jgi:hypothetical protein
MLSKNNDIYNFGEKSEIGSTIKITDKGENLYSMYRDKGDKNDIKSD